MSDTARVLLWGREIGAVTWPPELSLGNFQYTPELTRSGIALAPMMTPLSENPSEIPSLSREAFKGLPGLPDRFGSLLINAWLAQQGRDASSLSPVERRCYIGIRGMGGLEFRPLSRAAPRTSRKLEIADILRVGTSAGGARAKGLLVEVTAAVADLRNHAVAAGMAEADIGRTERTHRRELFV